MSRFSTDINAATAPQFNTNTRRNQSTYTHIVPNFRLVWLDASNDDVSDDGWRENIPRLRRIINTIDTFIDIGECIQFLGDIKDEMIFLVVTGYVGQHMVPIVHDITQLDSIYILCGNASRHNQWIEQWPKIKGTFTEISSICNALKQTAHQCDQDYIPIGLLPSSDNPSTQNLDQLDPSFMYSQILKDILLNIPFDKSHLKEFLDYCREKNPSDATEMSIFDQMERSYDKHTPIWWYTGQTFLYSMLNQALRQMEVNIIIKMGFYVSDLHRQIEALHNEQYGIHKQLKPFVVYRGQGLPSSDFARIQRMERGLISFNNFLSTSTNLDFSLSFARGALAKAHMVPIIFRITVDPSIPFTPFAAVKDFSQFAHENEILFSMHAVFRLIHLEKIKGG